MQTTAEFPGSSSGFIPKEFQLEDIEYLQDKKYSANWSQMGCFKSSTICWLVPRWAANLEIEKPKVLIITTKSGKGTYFKHIPAQLPDYELFNVHSNKISLVLGQDEIEFGIPDVESHACVFVAHYNVFSQRKSKNKETEKEDKTQEDVLQQLIDEAIKEDKGPSVLDWLKKQEWDIIILDEAHRIKERSTGWTKQIKKLKGKVKHIATGTGFVNNPAEVWSLLNFLDKREFGSYWRFRETMCDEDFNDAGYRVIRGINPERIDEFRALIRSVGPRRTMQEVFKDVPEPISTTCLVDLNATQRTMYESIKNELYALDQSGIELLTPNVLSALQRMRQICVATPKVVEDYYDPEKERRVQKIKLVEPSSKLDALMEIIEGLEWDEERRDQIVVFSNFKDPIELAIERFKKKGISYIEMKQSDNDRVRYEKWMIEFPKKEHQVFICTLQLGSESISLTSATTCVFLDLSWSPKDNSQGRSRVWRPGQTQVANIIAIHARDTVDNRVLAKVKTKTRWFNQIFSDEVDEDSSEAHFSEENILDAIDLMELNGGSSSES